MRVVTSIGTDQKGCTFHMYQLLKEHMRAQYQGTLEFREYSLRSSAPHFCVGCKRCFTTGENSCPHHAVHGPIWEDALRVDLLIFIYPMYVMRVPGALKALLDHWGVHWLSHRPAPGLFSQKALIITQGIGAPWRGAVKDVHNALTWMGMSDLKGRDFRLIDGVVWEELPGKRRQLIGEKLRSLAQWAVLPARRGRSLRVRLLFGICRALQRGLLKKAPNSPSLDTQYWLERGWIKKP